jgi:hypothetical protein
MNTQRSGEGAANAGATLIASITIIRATTGINIAMRLIRATSLSRAGLVSPAKLYNVPTLVRRDEIPMNPWPTSENSVQGKFAQEAHSPGVRLARTLGSAPNMRGGGGALKVMGLEGPALYAPYPVAMNPR